jgi:hypothetical protein
MQDPVQATREKAQARERFQARARAQHSRRRDKARYQSHGGEALVVELVQRLAQFPSPLSAEQLARNARQVAGAVCNAQKEIGHLSRTLVRQAIGTGYLLSLEGEVRLTRRARSVLALTPEGAQSPEHLPSPEHLAEGEASESLEDEDEEEFLPDGREAAA